ncbi:class-III pyridoxal-phosphate-dependent aminotransferase [Sutcliffiella rhizosphaerae]|uniref:Adenosylmethionine-8-amino-7-oxononanoate aminotransferase n=1 Tax=Sutcliffiella rhizosphaerae TaxID=2880967 RepID=A0ABM8YTW4_9BACI|nr:aspartate aminotransferase family protein [Sutcliffiella rhizosphaerae]CAG9623406.1 Adenosylmethionine-8-amino-7-oxononanoate aminotransferase [Sutcliffiella rhizosphaerae]
MENKIIYPFSNLSKIENLIISNKNLHSSWVEDSVGNHFYNISNASLTMGAANPEIINEITEQYKKLSTGLLIGQGHTSAMELANKLISIFPSFSQVFFSNDGTGCIEASLKIARQYYLQKGFINKKKFISFSGAYHGTSYGSFSLSNIGVKEIYGPTLEKCIEAPFPNTFKSELTSENEVRTKIKEMEEIIAREGADKIAAIIIEPIQSVSGVRVVPKEYLSELKKISKSNDILLIFDEVTTGIGRAGEWSVNNLHNIDVDIINFSKGLTAGYFPLGVTLVKSDIKDSLITMGFPHGSTLAGHPVGCAISQKVLTIIEESNLISNAVVYGKLIKKELENNLVNHPFFGQIRGEGLMIGVEFVNNQDDKNPPPQHFQRIFTEELYKKGMLTLFSNGILSLYPPLNVSSIDADFIIESIITSANSAIKNSNSN